MHSICLKNFYFISFFILALFFLVSFQTKCQKNKTIDTAETTYKNCIGFELVGRSFYAGYSLFYRIKIDDLRKHWVSLNFGYLSDADLSISYAWIPLKIGFFRFKTGIGLTQIFALYKSPGDSVDPSGSNHRPFYDFIIYPEIGLHFSLSKRVSLELNYLPIGYHFKDSYGNLNSFYQGIDDHNGWKWGGLQFNYRF